MGVNLTLTLMGINLRWKNRPRVSRISIRRVVCVTIRCRFDDHRLVMDGQTDRQTWGHNTYRASIASRGKNGIVKSAIRRIKKQYHE